MSDPRTFIVFLGVPGAGKGTQATQLVDKLGLPQISTGDLFRHHLRNNTELGQLAKSYMDKGALVPDEVTINMVKDRLTQEDCAKGAIMDGFPRNLDQAVAFDAIVAPYGGVAQVPMLEIDDDEAMRRITGRRSCKSCGSVYHVDFKPTQKEGVCDNCGESAIYQRNDDKPETVKERLYVYYKQTSPLIGYYFAKGLLTRIEGNQPIDQIQSALVELLS